MLATARSKGNTTDMPRIIYVDGAYIDAREAAVPAEDRGFQFGDAVYEVVEIRAGALVDETRHMVRLERSLGELHMSMPMSRPAFARVIRETIRRNRVVNGSVYLQVSRGAAPRDFLFPAGHVPQTVVVIARHGDPVAQEARASAGITVVTTPDTRWQRCDIKTVMLLPASLAKETARRSGAREAWFVDGAGMVTEGASSNAWIVTATGEIVTRPADYAILRGVTRTTAIDAARSLGLSFVERAFSVAEAKAAREAFITSAGNVVMPVVALDGARVGDGVPGPVAKALRHAFHKIAEQTAV